MKLKSLTAKLAALLCACGFAFSAWAADPVTIQDASGTNISVYEVSSGFYQNAATYGNSTDFYITSKAGLEYFRDLVSACDGGTAITAYINGGFYPGQNVPGVYSNNLFRDRKVNLLCDIDLENEDWTPIGYPNWAYNNGSSKTQFYGSFNGNGHKISNLKVVANAYNQNQGPNNPNNYYKNYGAYGLFGALGSSGSQVFENLTISNVTAVVGELPAEIQGGTYIGALVGNLGNNATAFRNCNVIGLINLQGSANSAGGLFGIGSANVENCVVSGDSGSTVVSASFGGGLVGAMRNGTLDLEVTGNTVSGVEITSYRAGSLVGAMALGSSVKGTCSVTDNDIVDCIVKGEAATLDNLFGPTTASTVMTYERNTVRTTLIVETGDLTPAEAITEETTAVNYTVPVTVKDRAGNVISETAEQEIAVSVGSEDVAEITLTSVKIDDVVMKAVESVGEDATSVTAIEIQVKASTEAEGEVQAITYEVHPEAIVTVSKTGEADATSTVQLSNTDLAADAEFSFELDVSSLTSISVGDQVRVTHSWDAYTDASGNAVAAGNETTLATVLEGKKVRITTKHFSSWTLEGVTLQNDTVAIVFAANGSEIGQYDSVAGAISADSTVNGCTVLVLDGTHDCGSSTITINKSITLTGQSKAGTVLNFTANGVNAFEVTVNSVTIKDMKINQADTDSYNTGHIGIGTLNTPVSGVVVQNVKFTGSKYSMVVKAASGLTVSGCDFYMPVSAPVQIHCIQGATLFSGNTFTMSPTAGSDGGMIYVLSLSGNTTTSSGSLTISDNVSTGGRALFFWNGLGEYQSGLSLNITGNVITEYNNKGIIFYSGSLGNYFSDISIISNVIYTSKSGKPGFTRIKNDGTLTIKASYNYWGDSPDFENYLSGTSKYLIDGIYNGNVIYEPYYITYNSTTGELSDLRPLPAVAQFISSDGVTTNKCETLQAAFNDAKNAGGGKVELLSNVELSAPVALDPTAAQLSNGNGSFVFDGCGYTISPAADWTGSDHVLQLGWGGSGAQTAEDHAANIAAQSQVLTNLTISGFTIVGSVFRSEDVTVTVVDCTFSGNTATTPGNRPGSVLLFSHAAATVTGCTFTGNTVDNVIDFNSQGGDGTNVGSGSVAVNNCLFNGNTCGSGVFYTTGCISKNVTISNSTFSGNSANASGAAMVYCSGTTTIEGCLFTNNTVRSTSKGGLVVLGSGASGTVISSNAFTSDNNLSGNTGKYGTVLVGSDCTANGNYWGDGQAPEAGSTNGSDIYLKDSPTVTASTYATAYAVNDNGRGVTVTIYVPPVAQIGETKYTTLDAAIAAAQAGDRIDVFEGTVEISNNVVIPQGVTIKGEGAEKTAVVIASASGDGVKVTNPNVTISNMTIDGSAITSTGYNSIINVKADGVVIDGVVMKNGGKSTWNSSILVEQIGSSATFTVKNSTISGSFRGVLRESCNANIVIDNCDIDAVYPFNIDGGNGGTVTVKDSSLHGWTSYSGIDSATFTNCEFSKAKSGYDVVAAYVNTTFTDCEFDSSFDIYAQTSPFTFSIIDCTKDETVLTWSNFKDYFTRSDVWNKCTCLVNGINVNSVAVAQIGDTKYTSLADAIAAVPADGDTATTITILANVTETSKITVAKTQNVVLELNGKTISATASVSSWRLIENRGTLTIKDSVGGGKITADGTVSSGELATIYNIGGTLNLVSGTIEYTGDYYISYAVSNSSNAWGQNDDKETVFNMTGGTISCPHGDQALRVYQNCADTTTPYSHNRVTISGGTILDTGIFVDTYIYKPAENTTGEGISTTIEINEGATVNGLIDMKLRHPFHTSLTINGGTFGNSKLRVRKFSEWNSAIAEPTDPVVVISGGAWLFDSSANSAFNVSGGWTTTSSWTSYKPYKVTGGVFNVDLNNYAGIVFEEGTTGVDNTDTETKEAYPYTVGEIIYVAQIGETQYETLQAALNAVQNGETIVILDDITETVYATSQYAYTEYTDKSFTIDFNGKTVTTAASPVPSRTVFNFVNKGSAARTVTLINGTITSLSGTYNCVRTQGVESEDSKGLSDADAPAAQTINIHGMTLNNNQGYGVAIKPYRNTTVDLENTVINSDIGGNIDVQKDSKVVIHNGTFKQTSGDGATGDTDTCRVNVSVSYGGVAEIRGGTFTSSKYGFEVCSSGGTITISDATATAGGYVLRTTGGAGTIEVSGGKFFGQYASEAGDTIAISGGYFSTKVPANYIVDGKLCTTKPTANGMYQVVLAKTVTYTGTAPEGVTGFALPAPASFTYPSGDLAEIALANPTYTSDDNTSEGYTFGGWQMTVGETTKVVSALPAGTKGDVTLVATWAEATKVTIQVAAPTNENPDATESIEVKLPDTWLAGTTVVNEVVKTNAAALNDTADNGLKVWENYVLGQDPTAKVKVESEQGASETAMPVKNTLAVQPVDTGFKVKYSLDKVSSSESTATVQQEGEKQDTSDLELNLKAATSGDSNVAYYKMTATIQKTTGETVSTVHSENTIGVLAVKDAPATAIIGVPWSSSTNSNSISVNDLVRTANLTPGDELKVYDPATKTYKMWTLDNDKEWEPVNTSSGSGTSDPGEAQDNTVARGAGVWLTRKNPDEPIYLVGQATAEAAATPLETPESSDDPTWNLVASPSVEPVDLADLLKDTETDSVMVPTESAPKNFIKIGDKWGYVSYETVNGRARPSFKTDDTKVSAGTGFWYLNGDSTKTELNW